MEGLGGGREEEEEEELPLLGTDQVINPVVF